MQEQYRLTQNQNLESLVPENGTRKSHNWIILIVGLIFFIILVTAAYFLFFSGSANEGEEQQLGSIAGPEVLLSEKIISPILSFSGETIWFMTDEGKMFRIGTETGSIKEEYLLPSVTYGVAQVIWEKDGSDFILEYISSGHTRYKYYDGENQTFVEYSEQMREISFLPGGDSIVYDWVTATSTHELKTALPSGDGFRTISPLFQPDYQVATSPQKAEVVLYRGSASDPSNLILVDLINGSFTDLDEKADYRGVRFSPDGKKVVVVKQGELAVYDLNTFDKVDLNVTAEIDEISWNESGTAIIIGNPSGFTRYDVASGAAAEIYRFSNPNEFSPVHPITHPDEPELYFVDEPTGYLYKVILK